MPLANVPIMLGRSKQSCSHLECQNQSLISDSIDSARCGKDFARCGKKSGTDARTLEQKGEVREKLEEYKEVFQWDECPVAFTHRIRHRIVLTSCYVLKEIEL